MGGLLSPAQGQISWVGGETTLFTSDDGITWSDDGLPAAMGGNNINDFEYGDGLWIAIGDGGKMMRSTDAVTWTATDVSGIFGTEILEAIHYSNDKDLWMVIGDSWTTATSSDGIIWAQQGDYNASGSLSAMGLTEGDGVWFAASYKGAAGSSELKKSLDDGATWVLVDSIDSTGSEGAMYANGVSFAATGGSASANNSR